MVAAQPLVRADAARRRSSSFRAGEGGRLVATLANGKEFEVGRITVRKPGERLALTWRQATFAPGQSTQLDVRFEAVGDQTRVTVEHRGWDEIPQDHVARHGFELMLFQRRELNTGGWCLHLLTRNCVATVSDGKRVPPRNRTYMEPAASLAKDRAGTGRIDCRPSDGKIEAARCGRSVSNRKHLSDLRGFREDVPQGGVVFICPWRQCRATIRPHPGLRHAWEKEAKGRMLRCLD
jgi:hypothetical protein